MPFRLEDEVVCNREIRNDGTYPGVPRGAVLVHPGEPGVIIDRGIFLQDRVVYAVYFTHLEKVVGCLEVELSPLHFLDR